MIRRWVVVALLVVMLASPASATDDGSVPPPYRFDDAADVAWGPGDVVSATLDVTERWVVWRMQLRGPLHLDQSPWRTGSASLIRISLPDRGESPEARVEVKPGPNGAVAKFTIVGSPSLCRTQLDQPSGLRSLRVRVHRPCGIRGRLDEFEVRGRVGFQFDRGGDGTVEQVDTAPDAGYTPWVRERPGPDSYP